MTSMDPGPAPLSERVLAARSDWAIHQTREGQPQGKRCHACPEEGTCTALTEAEQLLREVAEQARQRGGMFIWPAS